MAGTQAWARGGGPSRGSSRRRFLRRVWPAGGTGAMLATMGAPGLAPTAKAARRAQPYRAPRNSDFVLRGRGAAEGVAVGGGRRHRRADRRVRTGQAGYDCTVLEAGARAGGRNLTVRRGT